MAHLVYLPLPATSARAGRPVVAAAAPYLERPEDFEETCPPHAIVLTLRWPGAPVLLLMPQAMPGGACFKTLDSAHQLAALGRWEAWQDWFLACCLHRPQIPPRQIAAHFGADREALVLALLRLWSVIPDADGEWPRLPEPAYCEALQVLALRLRRPPSDFLRMSAPEFAFNWDILRPRTGRPDVTSSEWPAELPEELIES